MPVPEPAAPGREDELALLSRTLALLAGEVKARIGELTDERDRSAAVVDALVEGVVAVDAAGQVRVANRAAASLPRMCASTRCAASLSAMSPAR